MAKEYENKVLGCGLTEKEFNRRADNLFNNFKFKGLTVEETREICALDYTYSQGFDRTDSSLNRYKELSNKRIWN